MTSARRWSLTLSLVLAVLSGCASVENPVTGQVERTVMDEPSEIAEGRQQNQQVLAEYGAVKDAKLQAYVTALGLKLAQHSDRPNLEWHFTVLDSPEVNAFALPGGYVYVTRGILAYMNSEANLAGVMGHEIGHVCARHASQRATKQQEAGFGVLAATVLGAILEGRGVNGAGDLASQLSQNVAAGYIAKYSREQESQADELGAKYLYRSGYDPHNMLEVIQVLIDQDRYRADEARAQGRQAPQGPSWLADHPANEQRMADLQRIVSQYPAGQFADNGRTRYLQALDGLVFGDSREQGVVRGRNFFHEPLDFAITAPAGWQIDNQSNTVLVAKSDGSAALALQIAPTEAGSTPNEVLRNLVRPQQGNTEQRTVNGMPALHFNGTRTGSDGTAQHAELTIVAGPSARNYLLIYAAADASQLQRAYGDLVQAESSFRHLSAADRAAARPWHLHTLPLPAGGLAELARHTPFESDALGQLRLLNGVYTQGGPAPGAWVKTVQ
jgi:predicted Zn-dependent protease